MMKDFKSSILETKKISIWGIGYLGYTTALRVQSKGFIANIYDFQTKRVDDLQNGLYPYKVQKESWSKNGEIPLIDISKINIEQNLGYMFSSKVHIISFPLIDIDSEQDNQLSKILKVFIENKKILSDSLIVFQSVGIPKKIQKTFIDKIKEHGLNISIASAFRSDWIIEDFFSSSKRIIAGYNSSSLDKIKKLFEVFDLDYEALSSIEEAEIYENAKSSLQSTISAFFNQISIAYPYINVNELSSILLKNLSLNEIEVTIGSINYKVANATKHLLSGVENNNIPSIIQETESFNLSSILYYGDLLIRKNIKSVSILGVSTKNSLKDIRISSSIILAEYLNSRGVKIYINDSNFTKEELNSLLPFAIFFELKNLKSDAVVVMNNTKEYKFLNQLELDKIGISKAQIVIDNVGIFKNFKFEKETIYHFVGDGNLEGLKK